jgi:Tol biopolymer transport system component/PKD repeat protein
MKKFLAALLGLAASLQSVASAQTSSARIAYDACYAIGGDFVCEIVVAGSGVGVATAGVGPKWSPDGSRVAFIGGVYGDQGEILVVNVADGSVTNLSNHPARDGSHAWSRDGAKIAFASDRDGLAELYVMNADGSNPTRLTDHVGFSGQPVWSPDSRRIAFGCELEIGNPDICTINADGSGIVRLTLDPARDYGAVFSPVDGTIAFVTDRFGANEIAVLQADGTVRRVSEGMEPAWSPDGSQFAFTNGGDVFIVPAAGGQAFNLTNDALGYYAPGWSPDSSQLVFGGTATVGYSGICYLGEGAHNADEFCMPVFGIYVANVDGSARNLIAPGGDPDWFVSSPGRPLASFTNQCGGSTCDFDGSGSSDSDGTIASYAWRFGDGNGGSGPTANHAYATGGRYTVTLTVTDDAGTTGSLSMSVNANAPPVPSFTIACNGPTCTFDGSGSADPDGTITSYSWSFGDGAGSWSATNPTATHAYKTGTFTATLYVGDNGGAVAVQTASVSVVNASPVATFTHACRTLTCTFDGSGSSDPDGTISNYWWTFGDGANGWGATVGHAYAAAGTYTVSLTVSDNSGATTVQTTSLSLTNIAPVAAFVHGCNSLTCTFDGSGSSDSDGTVTTYSWVFGDGVTGSGAIATHAYAAAGTYTVTLTVRDNGGATTTESKAVTVTRSMHVGDLDLVGASQQTDWTASVTITAHDSGHQPLAGATVSGSWSNGLAGSCTTNGSGQCTLSNAAIPKKIGSISFTVVDVTHPAATYQSAGNHDPDGDSDGTSVRVSKP